MSASPWVVSQVTTSRTPPRLPHRRSARGKPRENFLSATVTFSVRHDRANSRALRALIGGALLPAPLRRPSRGRSFPAPRYREPVPALAVFNPRVEHYAGILHGCEHLRAVKPLVPSCPPVLRWSVARNTILEGRLTHWVTLSGPRHGPGAAPLGPRTIFLNPTIAYNTYSAPLSKSQV